VSPVLPLNTADVDQPEVHLVDQRRGLHHVALPFARHVTLRIRRSSPWTSGMSFSTAAASPPRQSISRAVTSCVSGADTIVLRFRWIRAHFKASPAGARKFRLPLAARYLRRGKVEIRRASSRPGLPTLLRRGTAVPGGRWRSGSQHPIDASDAANDEDLYVVILPSAFAL